MSTRLVGLVVDAARPAELAAFYAALLDWPVTEEQPDEVDLAPPATDGAEFELVFVPVPEPRPDRCRLHLDLASHSAADQQRRVELAIEHGAAHLDIGQGDVPWVVLADPEGNPFCVLGPNQPYPDTGAIGAVVIDAADPAAQAGFWSAATGWPVIRTDPGLFALRASNGRGPWLEFCEFAESKTTKNRLHLDVAPPRTGDLRAEADRLIALGAKPADVGQRDVPWVVLVDPAGNEFCVLTPR